MEFMVGSYSALSKENFDGITPTAVNCSPPSVIARPPIDLPAPT
jgi:hypothetical protein